MLEIHNQQHKIQMKKSKTKDTFDKWGTSPAAIAWQRQRSAIRFKDLPVPTHPESHYNGPPTNELNAAYRRDAIGKYEMDFPFAPKNRPAWLRQFELHGAAAL